MHFTRKGTIKYITDMAGELQKMAESNNSPVLSSLLKLAQMEGKSVLSDERVVDKQTSKNIK